MNALNAEAHLYPIENKGDSMTTKVLGLALCICLLAVGFPPVQYAADPIGASAGSLDQAAGLIWYEAALLGVEGKGWQDTVSNYDRLPRKARSLVRDAVWDLSHCAAGLQLRFATDAATLHVRWTLTKEELAMRHMAATGASGIDLYARGPTGKFRFVANGRPKKRANESTFNLPPREAYLLYLPLYNGVKRVEIGIPRAKRIYRLPGLQRQIVFYGTSITQGACASRPGMAATAIIGRELQSEIINLGFSGNGFMEIEMADLLSELDPAVYVLDCLANMSPQQVSERVAPFVQRIRQARPTTPILLVEDADFRDQPTSKGVILRQVFTKLKERGIHAPLPVVQ